MRRLFSVSEPDSEEENINMPSYSFQIRKADHPNEKGEFDLHVHMYYNERGPRRPLRTKFDNLRQKVDYKQAIFMRDALPIYLS